MPAFGQPQRGPEVPAPPAPALPRPFGDYELLSEIGRGGMGVIYKARQCCLDRLCALKMLHPGLAVDDEAEERLKGEAALAGSLDHPNIVAVYEVGREEGRLFYSMEYIAGEDLGRHARSRILRAADVARLARKIAAAVAYAHRRGVMHHELKPANVVIDESGEPQITDFGLARRVNSAVRSDPTQGAGSPNFMAPEQASARFGEPGVRTDVFGLGAILYFLLTDRPPFRGETPEDTLRAVRELDPVRPRVLRPGIPLDLETICLQCLDKQPARRYATAQEVVEELDRFLADEPIRARPAGPVERLAKWRRRHPVVSALVGVIALLLLAVAGVATGAALRIDRARARAETSELTTRSNLYSADMLLASQALAQGNEARVQQILRNYRPTVNGPDLRGWEWRFLHAASQGDAQAVLGAHGAAVGLARVTTDGRYAVTADAVGTLKTWDLTGRGPVATRQVREVGTPLFALNRTQTALATAATAADGTNHLILMLTLPELKSPSELRVSRSLLPVEFSADEGWLWCLERDALTEVEVATGRERRRIPLAAGGVLDFGFSPDHRWAASGEADGRIAVFETATGRQVGTLAGHRPNPALGWPIQRLVFSPDGRRVASSGTDGWVRIWDVERQGLVREISGHADVVMSVTFSPDGRRVASVGRDAFIQVTELAGDASPIRLRTGGAIQLAPAFFPDQRTLLTGGLDGRVVVWNPAPRPVFVNLTNLPPETVTAVLLEDRAHFATYTRGGGAAVHPLAPGAVRHRLAESTNHLSGWIAAGLHGDFWAAVLTAEAQLRLTHWPDGQEWRHTESLRRPPSRSAVLGVMVTRDGRYVVAWDLANGLRVWETRPWRLRLAMAAAPIWVRSSPGNQWLVVGEIDGRVRLWRLPSLEPAAFELHHPQLAVVEFSPDETCVATAGYDGVARLWRLPGGEPVGDLSSTGVGLVSLAWTPEATRLAGGTLDGEVVLWDLGTRRQSFSYRAHAQIVGSLGFLAEGSLVSFSPGLVRFWPVRAAR